MSKCIVCNGVLEDDEPVCMDEDAHGGYACGECCDDAELLDPCPTCNYAYCQCDAMYDSYKDSLLDGYYG